MPEKTKVEIPKIDIRKLTVTLVGDSPLVCHRISERAINAVLAKQLKKPKKGREAKDPKRDYKDSMYLNASGKPVFPTIAFKKAAVDACTFLQMTKAFARGMFHTTNEFTLIRGRPKMRRDFLPVGMGGRDVRFRAEFTKWEVELTLIYNATVVSPGQIINLLNIAGYAIGVGEHRPQKNGSWGMFHVKTTKAKRVKR